MDVRGRLASHRQNNSPKKNDNKDRDHRSCYGEKTKTVRVPESLDTVLEFFLVNYSYASSEDRHRYRTVLLVASGYVSAIRENDEKYTRENNQLMEDRANARKKYK
jgi:hypothetical protein